MKNGKIGEIMSQLTIEIQIIVKHTRSYGNDRFYAVCNLSKLICELLKRKSLTLEQIELIKKYNVEISYEK